MTQQIDIDRISPARIAGITFDTTSESIGTDVSSVYERLFGALAASGVAPIGPPRLMYHRMGESSWTVEAAVPISPDAGPQDLSVSDLPGGRAAVLVHTGPYDGLGTAWESIRTYIQRESITSRGIPYEEYLNDPSSTEPAKLEIKIVWPVEER